MVLFGSIHLQQAYMRERASEGSKRSESACIVIPQERTIIHVLGVKKNFCYC